jgi:hypothetical protein
MMKLHEIKLNQVQLKFAPVRNHDGIATGCLVAVMVVIFIFVALGVFVANNYQTWLAHGISAGMHTLIDKSDLPHQEKSEIKEIIDQLKDGYLDGEISLAELGSILERMGQCPAIPIGLVTQFEESYVIPSGLSRAEKSAANLNLNRLARGISGGHIGWEIIGEILAPISDAGEDGKQHLRAPAKVTDDDIREVLAAVQESADDAGISDEIVEFDISEEFKRSVEIALKRPIG